MRSKYNKTFLINAMSVGGGGGVAVACAYARGIKIAAEDIEVAVIILKNNRWHDEVAARLKGEKINIYVAPRYAHNVLLRTLVESFIVKKYTTMDTRLIQLNGQIPLFFGHYSGKVAALMQDPSPYVDATFGDSRGAFGAAIRRFLQKRALYRSDVIFWTSKFIQKIICSYHKVPLDTGHVVYNGISNSVLPRAKGKTTTTIKLVTVSNVSRYKGQIDVIRALINGCSQGILEAKNIEYSIIGSIEPEYEMMLKKLVSEHDLTGRIHFLGRISDDDRDTHLAECDIFIHLSRCESFGIPIVEAMAQGLPVIASNLCAIPEVAGDAAKLVDPDNLGEVSRAIVEIAQNSDIRNEMVRKGYENAKRFEWGRVINQIITLMD